MKKLLTIALCFVVLFSFGQSRPFPYAQAYTSGVIKPNNYTSTQLNDHVKAFYDLWKAEYFTNGCVNGQAYINYGVSGYSTVTEAMGYGMMITAYMAGYDASAKTNFDKLWAYCKAHRSSLNTNFIAWRQDASCVTGSSDDNSATDGDIDIAYALLLADKQWGSAGTTNYLQEAKTIISALISAAKSGCVNNSTWVLKLGDWATAWENDGTSGAYANHTRPSDFITYAFTAFNSTTGNSNWANVNTKCYDIISHMQTSHSSSTGLVPDFVVNAQNNNGDPAAANFLESSEDGKYGPNACRVPWRLALDYMLNGEAKAKTALDKINTWLKTASGGSASQIWPGYSLSGTPTSTQYQSSAFLAPFVVGNMVSSGITGQQTWVNNLYTKLYSQQFAWEGYYENSIKLMCMIAISGNWWKPEGGSTQGPYTLNISATNGTVSKSPNTATYAAGTVVTLTATPANGYSFQSWSGDASGTTTTVQVTMNSDKNVTASFISASACSINADMLNKGVWITDKDALGSTITPTTPTVTSGELTETFNIVKNATWSSWVSLESHTPDYMTNYKNMTSIIITYKSPEYDLLISLPQYPLYLDGASYTKSLPKTSTWSTVELLKTDFAIPSWYDGTYKTTALILDSVRALQFGPDGDVSAAAVVGSMSIKELKVCGVTMLITDDNLASSSVNKVYFANNTLHILSNTEEQFMLDIYSLDGKLISSKEVNISNGLTLEPLTEIQSNGLYFIKLSNDKHQYTQKVFVTK